MPGFDFLALLLLALSCDFNLVGSGNGLQTEETSGYLVNLLLKAGSCKVRSSRSGLYQLVLEKPLQMETFISWWKIILLPSMNVHAVALCLLFNHCTPWKSLDSTSLINTSEVLAGCVRSLQSWLYSSLNKPNSLNLCIWYVLQPLGNRLVF